MSRAANDRRNSSSRALGHSEYFGPGRGEIDLTLDSDDLISLGLALNESLDKHGISMVHEEVTRQPPGGYQPGSHLGRLVDLRRRVDAALHGRRTWNRRRTG